MRVILIAVAAIVLYISGTGGRQFTKKDLHARQVEAAKRWYSNPLLERETSTSTVKNITFSNPKASGLFLAPISMLIASTLYCRRIFCEWDKYTRRRL